MPKTQRKPVPVVRTADLWLLLLSGVGVLLSAYLVWTRVADAPTYCPLGSGGCDVVQSSRFAAVFGIPVALLGLVFYAFLFLIAARPLEPGRRLSLALPAAFAGVGSSAVFMIVQQTVIRATCSLCIVSALLTAAIVALLVTRRPLRITRTAWVASAGMFVIAAVFLLWGYAASAPPAPEATYADGLARHLTATGAKFYGTYWCRYCTEQKKMFGKAAGQLPYVECDARSPGGRQITAVCAAAKIQGFPTWDIAGKRYVGLLPLEELARLTGYSPPP